MDTDYSCHNCGRTFAIGETVEAVLMKTINTVGTKVTFSEKYVLICASEKECSV